MKIHHGNSIAAKEFDNRSPLHESFGMDTDFTEPEQSYRGVEVKRNLSFIQWPDNVLPEFRKVLCECCAKSHEYDSESIG
jgi:hypothetical protein